MTTEEKAKAYDKAIERAKEYFNSPRTCFDIEQLCNVFPELAESEDERIKQELISFFTERAKYTEDSTFNGLSSKEIITWLEKQSKQKYTQRDIDDAYLKGIADVKREVEKIDEQTEKMKKEIAEFIFNSKEDIKQRYEWIKCLGFDVKFSNEEKQDEQKLAWSEEDDRMLDKCIKAACSNYYPGISSVRDWLKSLKERYTWKPSDEQMADLWNMVCECRPADQQLLQDIYYGLKTLRGE